MIFRRIAAADAELLRHVRLRALSDSPMAFGSTYARELAFESSEWQRRCDNGGKGREMATFLACDTLGRGCGIIGCVRKTDEPHAATIVSMWVDPTFRRQGIARGLLDSVEAWAAQSGCRSLFLDVVENNSAAIALYARCGFEFTGHSFPYPNDARLRERCMRKVLPVDGPVK